MQQLCPADKPDVVSSESRSKRGRSGPDASGGCRLGVQRRL